MKMQRIKALVIMEIKKLVREPALLFMLLLFPAVLTIALGLAFGELGNGSTIYNIGIVNYDTSESYGEWSQYLIGNLSETELFYKINYTDIETAEADLKQGNLQAVLIIPENFGESCNSYWSNPIDPSSWINTTVDLLVDSGSIFAVSAIPPLVQQVIAITLYGERAVSVPSPIELGNPSEIEASEIDQFDYMAPGLFAFASLFIIMIIAQSFTEARDQGLLKRINITPTTSTEFMGSQIISNMIIAIFQVILIFIMAFLIGYRPLGGLEGILMAFIIMIIFSLCSIGFGLITAAVSKSSGAATGISFIFIIPQMFFGTIIPLGTGGPTQIIGLFLPSYYVTDALTSIFLRGAPITSPTILLDITVVTIMSVIISFVGILLFKKYGKK
jgi:ABC-2 type transport system permease protein